MSASDELCANCRHGRPISGNDQWLQCHRYPPTSTAHNPIHAIFPLVNVDDYCSEWTATSTNGESNMGVTDGSDALPGEIGEYLTEDNVLGYNLVPNTPTEICPISLPPGCWEIWGACDFTVVSGTERVAPIQPNELASSISLHNNTLPTQDDLIVGTGVMNLIYVPLAIGQRLVLITGQCRSNSAEQVNLYLVAETGMANVNTKGYISARRVR